VLQSEALIGEQERRGTTSRRAGRMRMWRRDPDGTRDTPDPSTSSKDTSSLTRSRRGDLPPVQSNFSFFPPLPPFPCFSPISVTTEFGFDGTSSPHRSSTFPATELKEGGQLSTQVNRFLPFQHTSTIEDDGFHLHAVPPCVFRRPVLRSLEAKLTRLAALYYLEATSAPGLLLLAASCAARESFRTG
jgi:hypothetical protein